MDAHNPHNSAKYDISSEFDVRKELGRGAFSIVSECHKKGTEEGAPTAVKITPIKTLREQLGFDDLDAFVARIERMKALNDAASSPGILKFYDWRFTDTDYVAFFQYCQGGDLFQRIVDSPAGHLTEDEARRATRTLVVALAESHEVGLIHRDLKPENLLYHYPQDDSGDVVIADWGVAVEGAQPEDTFTELAGTAGYMAPELAAGQPYGAAVDIFSLGITAYEMLTGRSPFVGETPDALIQEVIERDVTFPKRYWSGFSPECVDCVKCMVERDPTERWTAEELLGHPWFATMSEKERRIPYHLGSLREELGLTRRDSRALRQISRHSTGSSIATDDSGETSSVGSRMTHIGTRAPSMRKKKDSKALEGMYDTKSVLEGRIDTDVRERLGRIEI